MYFLCGVQEISCCKNNTVFLENKRDEVPFIYKSNRSQVFLKIGVIKTFPYFTGNHLCGSHFIRMKIQHRCFPVKFEKFLRAPFLYRIPLVAVSVFKKAPSTRFSIS